ncbi:hypothetical protein BX600DRAFT_67215 [Xylariales sp. PMI_506]|nr:hypothetical protein BX600DRAFT_67215 [Xylariales sp. PMI_506]
MSTAREAFPSLRFPSLALKIPLLLSLSLSLSLIWRVALLPGGVIGCGVIKFSFLLVDLSSRFSFSGRSSIFMGYWYCCIYSRNVLIYVLSPFFFLHYYQHGRLRRHGGN